MIFAIHRLSKICLILLLFTNLIFFTCRDEHTGCVSLIFDEHTVPPRGMLEDLKEEIEKIEYIQKVEILGLPEHVLDIVPDKQKLEAIGLSEEEFFRQIQNQIQDVKHIQDMESMDIKLKNGNFISLTQIASIHQSQKEHNLFHRGKRVYVINIEYDKDMHGQLTSELEEFRERSWMEFIIDINCEDFDKQQTEDRTP